MLTHFPFASRMTGPWCVRYTVNSFFALPVPVLYGTTMLVATSGRSSVRRGQLGTLVVEGRELGHVDALDVAADAPLAEGERHPRLEPGDDARLHPRMGVEIVVQPVRVCVHQRLQPRGTRGVLRLH